MQRAVWGMLYADDAGIVPKSAEGLAKMIASHRDCLRSSRPHGNRKKRRRQCSYEHQTGRTSHHRSSSKQQARGINKRPRIFTQTALSTKMLISRSKSTDGSVLRGHASNGKITRCKSIETTIRKRWLLVAGAVARQSKERLPSRVMLRTMADGENPRPGGQFKTWHRCGVEDLTEFRATEGSTELAP